MPPDEWPEDPGRYASPVADSADVSAAARRGHRAFLRRLFRELLVATVIAFGTVAGFVALHALWHPDQTASPATQTTSLPLQPIAPVIGGDDQVPIEDLVRKGLTNEQVRVIAENCNVSPIPPNSDCPRVLSVIVRVSGESTWPPPTGPSAACAPATGSPSTSSRSMGSPSTGQPACAPKCDGREPCMIMQRTRSGNVFLEVIGCPSGPGHLCLLLQVPLNVVPVITGKVTSPTPTPASPSPTPATPTSPSATPTSPSTVGPSTGLPKTAPPKTAPPKTAPPKTAPPLPGPS
jgi:hypothetical protein